MGNDNPSNIGSTLNVDNKDQIAVNRKGNFGHVEGSVLSNMQNKLGIKSEYIQGTETGAD